MSASVVVAVVTTIVSVISAVAALVSAHASKTASSAADRSAKVAERADHRTRTPDLVVTRRTQPGTDDHTQMMYRVRNDGPQSLTSIIVHGPVTERSVIYKIASNTKAWAGNVDLGPLVLGAEVDLKLSVGQGQELPDFRVRITCSTDEETWELLRDLEIPAHRRQGFVAERSN